METKDVLVCITNHNFNANAFKLKNDFSKFFDVITIDSGSDDNEGFDVKLGNVYYTGLFNVAIQQTKASNKKYCYFIASDVTDVDVEAISRCLTSLPMNVGVWSPSSKGQSHPHCKNMKTKGIRDVAYVEGFTFLCDVNIVDDFYPVDLSKNKYGYGLDLMLGYYSYKNAKSCVVDDRVEVTHRVGTGYDGNAALKEMYQFMMNINELREYTFLYSKNVGSDILTKYLLGMQYFWSLQKHKERFSEDLKWSNEKTHSLYQ